MTFVTLKIYNFKIFSFVKEFHCEITAYGLSWSFSEDGLETSEIMNKHNYDGYELVKSYSLGFSGMPKEIFASRYLPALREAYTIDEYDLFNKNCRHFSLEMIKILRPSRRERGLRTLSKLNDMSQKIGQFCEVVIRNIFNIVADPKRVISAIFFAIMCYNQGKIFNISVLHKDFLSMVLFLVTLLLFLMRKRL